MNIDPVIQHSFQVIVHLNQLAEALALALDDCSARSAVGVQVAHCCDRAEHIGGEFLPGAFGQWPDKASWMREQLALDVSWMLDVIEFGPVKAVLDRTPMNHPKRAQLQELLQALQG